MPGDPAQGLEFTLLQASCQLGSNWGAVERERKTPILEKVHQKGIESFPDFARWPDLLSETPAGFWAMFWIFTDTQSPFSFSPNTWTLYFALVSCDIVEHVPSVPAGYRPNRWKKETPHFQGFYSG